MPRMDDDFGWRPAGCDGETCALCSAEAVAKISEEIACDDPFPDRHPLTSYLCRMHFRLVMGDVGVNFVENFREKLLGR